MEVCEEFKQNLTIMCPRCHDIQTYNNCEYEYDNNYETYIVRIKCDTCGFEYYIGFEEA